MGPNWSGVLTKRRNSNTEADIQAYMQTHTHTMIWEKAHESKGRNWGDSSTSQGTPKIASKTPETRKRQEGFPRRFQGAGPCQGLLSDFWPPER